MTAAARLDEITLAHGGSSVRLRPCLRAASYFAREGFADLPKRIADFHLGTIRELVTSTATDQQAATAFLTALDATPLKAVADTITVPLLVLVAGFIPAPDANAKPTTQGKPMPWPAVYRELFRTATGWLGWTPEAAWQATPTEINEAFAGHIAKLKAIHGVPEKEADKQPNVYSAEQFRQIDEEGLDPEFDREGLRRLKAEIARKQP